MHLTNMYSVDDNITCRNYQYIEFMEDPKKWCEYDWLTYPV